VAAWHLGLVAFHEAEPVGEFTLRARDFPVVREVTTSSWLGLAIRAGATAPRPGSAC
jgi:hypothetical protein